MMRVWVRYTDRSGCHLRGYGHAHSRKILKQLFKDSAYLRIYNAMAHSMTTPPPREMSDALVQQPARAGGPA